MTREDFKISGKYYDTNELTYILYNGIVIGYAEIYQDFFFKEVSKDKWESQKKKRNPTDITNECESIIRKYILANG